MFQMSSSALSLPRSHTQWTPLSPVAIMLMQIDGELLVLMDVTPSQEMVDEGIAREVVN